MGISVANAAYIAGLFDGEGSVYFKRTKQRRNTRPGKPVHNITVIRMEISMTDKSVLEWIWETMGVGSFGSKKVKEGYKPQWRWRIAHRDALYVAKIIWPYAHVKLHKIEQIIDHYDPKTFDGNVVSLAQYRNYMGLGWHDE